MQFPFIVRTTILSVTFLLLVLQFVPSRTQYTPDEDPWANDQNRRKNNQNIVNKDYGAQMWIENDPGVQLDRRKHLEEGANGRAMVWTARREKDELKQKVIHKNTKADFCIDYLPEKETQDADEHDKIREEKIKRLSKQAECAIKAVI